LADPVSLVEVTAATVLDVCRLEVAPDQTGFVAPNAFSIAQAHFEPAAWFRAIAAGESLVGFAMLYDPTLPGVTAPDPNLPDRSIMLWRFMIDARHQGRGHGRAAIALLADHVRGRGAEIFAVTYHAEPGGPEDFYRRLGFIPTGRVIDGEAEAILALDPVARPAVPG
jgi:diamine N-acetyltransferase